MTLAVVVVLLVITVAALIAVFALVWVWATPRKPSSRVSTMYAEDTDQIMLRSADNIRMLTEAQLDAFEERDID